MIARNVQKKTTGGLRVLTAIFLAACVALVLSQGLARAAAGGPVSDSVQVSTDDLQSLLNTIESPADREKLAAQLRAMIAARQQAAPSGTGEHLFAALSDAVDNANAEIATIAQALVNVPDVFTWVGRQAGNPEARANVLEIALKLCLVIGIGWLAQRVTVQVLARPRRAAEMRGLQGGFMRWGMRLAHIAIDIAPVIVFAAVAYAVLPFLNPNAATRAVAIAVVNAVVVVRLLLVLAGAVLAPDAPGLRLLPIGDESAHYDYLWVRRLAGTSVYGYFAAEAALALGLHRSGFDAVLNVLGLVVAFMLVILVLQNRRFIANHVRSHRVRAPGERPGTLDSLRALLADTWHILAILYMAALYVVWALRVPGGFEFVLTASVLTIVIIAVSQFLVAVAERAINRGFSIGDDVKRRFPSLEARANRYLPVLFGMVKTVVCVIAALALLQVWGMQSLTWVSTGVGREIVGTLAGIALVIAIAAVFWEGVTLYMESYMSRTATDYESLEKIARARTILPLFRKALFIVLLVVVSLVILAQIGINIGPLLAGAGIIGLAIGVGAQKLVQDILNGLFIYLEAAVAVGDIIQLGNAGGVVEAMSMRSIRLRDYDGSVYTVPFSSVTTVLNRTKGFSYYVFNVGVTYGEDVDRVISAMKEVGAAMQREKDFSGLILAPVEVDGVDKLADMTMVVLARIKTLPAKQWLVGREFNRRLMARFDELGIVMPYPQAVVEMGARRRREDAETESRDHRESAPPSAENSKSRKARS